jgi:DNA-binding response OmpR family regulator
MGMTRVLIVDDDPQITSLLRRFLERTGRYQVRTVNRARTAVDEARTFQPQVVVLDVCMPDMDGTEVAGALEAIPEFERTPVLFLTGIATPDEIGTSGWESGSRVCLPKPVPLSELLRRLDYATA